MYSKYFVYRFYIKYILYIVNNKKDCYIRKR